MIFDSFDGVAIFHIDVAVVLPEEILAVRHDICISVLHSLTLSERDVRVTPLSRWPPTIERVTVLRHLSIQHVGLGKVESVVTILDA